MTYELRVSSIDLWLAFRGTSINDDLCFRPFLLTMSDDFYPITSNIMRLFWTPLSTLKLDFINGHSPSLYVVIKIYIRSIIFWSVWLDDLKNRVKLAHFQSDQYDIKVFVGHHSWSKFILTMSVLLVIYFQSGYWSFSPFLQHCHKVCPIFASHSEM